MKKMRFLFLLGLLFGLFVLNSRTYAQEVIENKKIGIKISKPLGWNTATNADLQNNLDRISFNEEELQKVINSNKGVLTLVSYFKYNLDSVIGLIPTIKVTIRINPTSSMEEFKQVMVASTDRMKKVLKNFEFIENFIEVSVSGFQALYYNSRYSLLLADGDIINVRNRYYMIPKGDFFITVSLMDNETNEDCTKVMNTFMKDLQLTK